MVELTNVKDGKKYMSKRDIVKEIKQDNPEISDEELNEMIVKESFTVKS